MPDGPRSHPHLVLTAGTRVVTLKSVTSGDGAILHPRGAVGMVARTPGDADGSCRVCFSDGVEVSLDRRDVTTLAQFGQGPVNADGTAVAQSALLRRVILRCVVGSRAYGLDDAESDIDRRGIYIPPAELHWSLYGVPRQVEVRETDEVYWEIQRFIVLALKANPSVLECLYTPIVEMATPLAEELLGMRSAFLSRLVYQTHCGYVMSQCKKIQADLRDSGQVKWKHAMHLVRLLISGIHVLRHGFVPVRVDEHRAHLLAIRRGGVPWEDVEQWRLRLQDDFAAALQETKLPERPDYEKADDFLIRARRAALRDTLP